MSDSGPERSAVVIPGQETPTQPKRARLALPRWYWPWWVILGIAVTVLMAISYFAGMLTTVSQAHTLLSSLHQQLGLVAQQKARLNKQAQALGVLSNLRSGHWSNPAVWAVFLPMWIWFLTGMLSSLAGYAAVRRLMRRSSINKAGGQPSPSYADASESPRAPSPSRRSAPSSSLKWTREFIGLVIWVGVIAALGFAIIHGGTHLGPSFWSRFRL